MEIQAVVFIALVIFYVMQIAFRVSLRAMRRRSALKKWARSNHPSGAALRSGGL